MRSSSRECRRLVPLRPGGGRSLWDWLRCSSIYAVAVVLLFTPDALAVEKSGVKPQVISLPSGPGSIEGLGPSFEPQLNTGTAAYSAAGRYPEAAREIDLAVRARPRDLALRRQASQIHEKAGNPERAIGHLEMAIQLAPEDGTIWIDLGDLQRDRDNVADAYVAYRRAAKLEPNDLRAVSGLAKAADGLGFRDEAESAYERWAELEKAIEE